MEHLATDPKFDDNSKRVKNRELLVPSTTRKNVSYCLCCENQSHRVNIYFMEQKPFKRVFVERH